MDLCPSIQAVIDCPSIVNQLDCIQFKVSGLGKVCNWCPGSQQCLPIVIGPSTPPEIASTIPKPGWEEINCPSKPRDPDWCVVCPSNIVKHSMKCRSRLEPVSAKPNRCTSLNRDKNGNKVKTQCELCGGECAPKEYCKIRDYVRNACRVECFNKYPSDFQCAKWADTIDSAAGVSYCHPKSQYYSWMFTNCEKSCNLCYAAPSAKPVCKNKYDIQSDCERWSMLGYCSHPSHEAFMRHNCAGTCSSCGFSGLPPLRSLAPTFKPSTKSPTKKNSDPFVNKKCVSLNLGRRGKVSDVVGHMNIILVPSGFDRNMKLFMQKAKWIYKAFQDFKPLDASKIDMLNVWVVNKGAGAYCEFNCNGVGRLLCCSQSKALKLAEVCGGVNSHILVVHNSEIYGGSGGGIGTTSINALAPLIAVHELGHSIFDLGDEYDWINATPQRYANCDVGKCRRWEDLADSSRESGVPEAGIGCFPGCAGSYYYTSQPNTIMRSLAPGLQFMAVNERITCCKFIFSAQTFYPSSSPFDFLPEYCKEFDNLELFCNSQSASGVIDFSAPMAAEASLSMKDARLVRFELSWTSDTQFTYKLKLKKKLAKEMVNSVRSGTAVARDAKKLRNSGPGRVLSADDPEMIYIHDAEGNVVAKLYPFEDVEFPNEDMTSMGGWTKVKRDAIEVVIEEGMTVSLSCSPPLKCD